MKEKLQKWQPWWHTFIILASIGRLRQDCLKFEASLVTDYWLPGLYSVRGTHNTSTGRPGRDGDQHEPAWFTDWVLCYPGIYSETLSLKFTLLTSPRKSSRNKTRKGNQQHSFHEPQLTKFTPGLTQENLQSMLRNEVWQCLKLGHVP